VEGEPVKIASIESRLEHLGLTRPYRITGKTVTTVDNVFVFLRTEEGVEGVGIASPGTEVTGETLEACVEALRPERLAFLVGRDLTELPLLAGQLALRMPGAPAARAAVDTALHDAWARSLSLPLARLLGRAHGSLETSITIGIKPVAETLAEAEEYLGRGFSILKVKTGEAPEEDLERVRRLRERFRDEVRIRVDANQGYTAAQTVEFFRRSEPYGVEFVEQPLPADRVEEMRLLPAEVRARIAVDESLLSPADALALATPEPACGIFNIKLMKCGGIRPALAIAAIAETAGIDLMWGCMDESVVGITAALHAALASPATRYLDLDGSLDLATDLFDGGFRLESGKMDLLSAPGLGVMRVPG
jgi:L-alanine-DL-glutamate epimerase-like enolase superfamily enzyme